MVVFPSNNFRGDFRRARNARIAKHILIVGAARGKFRNYRSLAPRLKPVRCIRRERILVARFQHDLVRHLIIRFRALRGAASGVRRLRVYSDSQLIVNQIKGIYKVKHPDLRPLHERAKKQAATLETFTIQYVPREQNRDADDLANAALDSTSGVKPAYNAAPAKAVSPAAKTLSLEDLRVGQKFTSGTYRMDEGRIKSFAAEFDPQPFHLDDVAARHSIFRGLAASGWHTAAATMRLLVTSGLPFAGGLVGLGGEITWARPTRPGDTLRVDSEILAIVPSRSKPNQAVVTVRSITVNQNGDEVQNLTTKILAFNRNQE